MRQAKPTKGHEDYFVGSVFHVHMTNTQVPGHHQQQTNSQDTLESSIQVCQKRHLENLLK